MFWCFGFVSVFSLWCYLFVIDYAALGLFGLVCFGLLFWRSVCVCAFGLISMFVLWVFALRSVVLDLVLICCWFVLILGLLLFIAIWVCYGLLRLVVLVFAGWFVIWLIVVVCFCLLLGCVRWFGWILFVVLSGGLVFELLLFSCILGFGILGLLWISGICFSGSGLDVCVCDRSWFLGGWFLICLTTGLVGVFVVWVLIVWLLFLGLDVEWFDKFVFRCCVVFVWFGVLIGADLVLGDLFEILCV